MVFINEDQSSDQIRDQMFFNFMFSFSKTKSKPHSWTPPPQPPPNLHLIKGGGGGGEDLPKIESLGGNEFFCEKGGINLIRGVYVKMESCQFFLLLYSSVQSHLLFWIFSLLSYPCKNIIHVLIKVSKSCTKT